ncbi:MAG: hypothetical protein ACE5KM_04540 [Planctomycetaceae bacterium]
MAFEIECGTCGHRLSVDDDAFLVVCPACETSLQVPHVGDDVDGSPGLEATVADTLSQHDLLPPPNSVGTDEGPVKSAAAFPGLPGSPSSLLKEMPAIVDDGEPEFEAPGSIPPGEQPIPELPEDPDAEGEESPTAQIAFPLEAFGDADAHASETADPARERSESLPSPPTSPSQRRSTGVPRFLFVMVAGYASAATIALIWLWFQLRANQLESLPDVLPRKAGYLLPEDAPMPWGHTLRLGQTRRFGNLEITATGVSRGPAVIFDRDRNVEELTDTPVLKLRLKIHNVSGSQSVMPFGRKLLLTRSADGSRANTFVCRDSKQRRKGVRLLPYRLHISDSGIVLKDQDVDRKLRPGEEFETYIATDTNDDLDTLRGALIWRIHIRKGHNWKSGNGVTTLIEFRFHSGEIEDETG